MPDSIVVKVAAHPLLHLEAFETVLPKALEAMPSDDGLKGLFRLDAPAPMQSDDATRAAIRDLLRQGGFKPTGRSKPASEYLLRASGEGQLSSINLLVDACNAVSLHSGLPISVVDLDRTKGALEVKLAGADAQYIFNASGQTIDVEGLLCLFDAEGPCANAVKDSQRTKTHPGTTRTLSVLWGAVSQAERTTRAARWYRALLEERGAKTHDVALERAAP
jgi:DNA/RNA-binding domain of Phe-tRNA-synthetase-like protein